MDLSVAAAIALAAIVFLAYTTQAITGFGSSVITVTISALFLPVNLILPVAVALNLPFCAWLVWRNYSAVDWPLLRRSILPLMLTGLVIGALLAWRVEDLPVEVPLGILVVVCSLIDIYRVLAERSLPMPVWLQRLITLLAGAAQGFAASGGPLLAVALANSGLPKARLRASLSVVWFLTNSLLTIGFVSTGRYSLPMAGLTAALLPVMLLALAAGEWAHHRVSERQFRLIIDLLLLVAGLALLF